MAKPREAVGVVDKGFASLHLLCCSPVVVVPTEAQVEGELWHKRSEVLLSINKCLHNEHITVLIRKGSVTFLNVVHT